MTTCISHFWNKWIRSTSLVCVFFPLSDLNVFSVFVSFCNDTFVECGVRDWLKANAIFTGTHSETRCFLCGHKGMIEAIVLRREWKRHVLELKREIWKVSLLFDEWGKLVFIPSDVLSAIAMKILVGSNLDKWIFINISKIQTKFL